MARLAPKTKGCIRLYIPSERAASVYCRLVEEHRSALYALGHETHWVPVYSSPGIYQSYLTPDEWIEVAAFLDIQQEPS